VEKIRKGENVDVDEYMGNKPRPKPVINPILASSPVKHLAVNTPTHKYNKSPKKKKGDLRYSQFATPSQYTQHPHVFQQQQQLFHQQIPVKQVIQLTTFLLSKTTNLSLNYIAPTPQFIQSVSSFFLLYDVINFSVISAEQGSVDSNLVGLLELVRDVAKLHHDAGHQARKFAD